ncbi:TPA: NADP-dependent oxidoreductase [Escherichia coli]|uniref:NADP-dependent oxidoreductase n=1 Tax=Escherichia sp. WS2659_1 TaxID=3381966 RepID=UPI0012EF73C8|nr:NADP-dependent oxidoreductase [Salmonella enterica subsp. enterica serovar Senftenberg]HBL4712710.1 NADP-dependent oxidoreductase [Escherichia coli]HCP1229662.1 NADP-dependent oxidoreductase [Escherichia coli]
MTEITQTRIVLASRPVGEPKPEDFRLEQGPLPQSAAGQLLLETLYLSLDPYMRGRMSDAPSYAPPWELGAVPSGGAVSRVAVSHHPDFQPGDLVLGDTGWQSHTLSDGHGLSLLDRSLAQPSLALSVLGMPGFTAYHGLLNIGRPQAGETVVVASATGAVGSVVGQLARLKGARAIGIAGGEEKCRYAVEALGFDVCLDHRAPDFAEQLAAATPQGIDVYYENVGGAVLDAVLPRLNVGARVPVCGLIAHYNDTDLPPGPDRMPMMLGLVLRKRLLLQGFIIGDHYADGFAAFQRDMGAWVAEGKVSVREDFVEGLEHAPQALIDLLAGRHFGKVVVRVGTP